MSVVCLLTVMAHLALGAAPMPSELDEARAWVAAKFEGKAAERPIDAHIEVLANNDPVQLNSRGGKPLRLGERRFEKGLYCHAVSHLVVYLPGPAIRFAAVTGVDSNEQTSGGRGSVVFSVRLDMQEVWRSHVMREGMPAMPAEVQLGGATSFELLAGDAGDGIGCDQANWADARVTLSDGTDLWLSDLPIRAHARAAYTADPFFSFVYGDRPSAELLAEWPVTRTAKKLDDRRTRHELTWTDPETRLEVRCAGVAYSDFPVAEWTLYFKNGGAEDTPILKEIRAADTRFESGGNDQFTLHRNKGDNCTADSFEPVNESLGPNASLRVANTGGRPTQIAFPYFNIEYGQADDAASEGVIAVVSWAGQWAADFIRDAGYGLQFAAGQELTHFLLHPGEEVRSPMIVVQFWQGGRQHAQNVWRAWMLRHNLPRPGGKLPPFPQLAACSSHQFAEMIQANTDSQKFFIDKYLERGIKLDYWWMDAGWYYNKGGWPNTGTWEVDEARFPGGLRPISDHAHGKEVDIIVWFEPERVTAGTWLAEQHPEWIHGGKSGGLLDLGNAEARQWLTDHVDALLTGQGIDLYRQDFNMDPLNFWRDADMPDRLGITEIRHVEGYFAYWDELLRRHPNMLIDSCASGGRRNDLETLRRAVPLLRSDYIMEPVGNQCHTWALASWFPFYGTGTSKTDSYLVRSTLCPHFTACWDQRDDTLDYAALRREIENWRGYGANYAGDFYPITPYSLAEEQWIGWQFNRPGEGTGLVQAFRRAKCVYESARLPLMGLDAKARYQASSVDAPDAPIELTGEALMKDGLPVVITEKPGAAIYTYAKR